MSLHKSEQRGSILCHGRAEGWEQHGLDCIKNSSGPLGYELPWAVRYVQEEELVVTGAWLSDTVLNHVKNSQSLVLLQALNKNLATLYKHNNLYEVWLSKGKLMACVLSLLLGNSLLM